ncbi:MAG: phytoene desaturase family protein [Candidatus Thorarchaeota archaeon]
MADYDVIIIGDGIVGTAFGAILASKNLKILLNEKSKFLGGRCSTYEKDGFKIDFGIHLIGRPGRGPHGKVLEMIDMKDAIDWVSCRNPGPGPRWYYNNKFWSFPSELNELIPNSDYSNLMKLFIDFMKIKDTKELETISVKDFLLNYTEDSLVHTFINVITALYFVIPYYEASADEFIKCLSSLSLDLSIGYPKGGCISMPQAYANGIEKYGGILKTKLSAKRIKVEDEKVQGVELGNNELISSPIVISNTGIRETINNMIGKKYFDQNYLKEINKFKYSMSGMTLKIALKRPITNYKLVNSFSLEYPEELFNSILKGRVPDNPILFILIPSNFDPNLAPKGKQLIIAGTAVASENFEKNKEKWVINSMRSLENVFPELSDNFLWYEITNPKDIDTLGGKEASVIGLSQIIDQTGSNRSSQALPIEGLYLVGSDAGGWGIGTELAAKSAIECSKMILEKQNTILE